MNKATAREVQKIEALRDPMTGSVEGDDLRGYAARALTALHRAAGPKVQAEISQVIDRLGLWSAIRSDDGVLTAT